MWLPADRAHVRAWRLEERARHTCGQPVSLSFDKRGQHGTWKAKAVRCHACAALERAMTPHEDKAGLSAVLTHGPYGPIGEE